jgi:uncharacterized protein YwqG
MFEVERDLRAKLAPLARVCWRPIVTSTPERSRFGGVPTLPPKASWPACSACKEPMAFALQIALDQLPEAHPSRAKGGLLQLFFCTDCDHGFAMRPTHVVRILETEGARLKDAAKKRQTWKPVHITGWTETSDLPYREPGLEPFDRLTAGLPAEEEDLLFRLNVGGDKAAGWPKWVQENRSPACPACKEEMRRLVLQIGSKDHLDHRFGDNGVAYVLQCEAHPSEVSFQYQCG